MQKVITKRSNGSIRVANDYAEDNKTSPTQQQFKKDCDVNNIIKRFKTTGQITHLSGKKGRFIDTTQLPASFEDAMTTVAQATSAFMELDADTRAKFRNDPGYMLAWLEDTKNDEEAIKLGFKQRPEQKPDLVSELKNLNQNLKQNNNKDPIQKPEN